MPSWVPLSAKESYFSSLYQERALVGGEAGKGRGLSCV
jgi:hypothetical protein